MKLAFLIVILLMSNIVDAKSNKTIGDILKKIKNKSVNIKKSNTVIPSKALRAKRVKRVNLDIIKPPTEKKFIGNQTQSQKLESFIDEEIRQLYSLTKQYKRSKKRGEIWLRLAEAYVDKAKIVESGIHEFYDKKLEKYLAGKTKRKPKLNLKPAYKYNQKSIQLYEWYVRDYPKGNKLDQSYFFLGYNYLEIERPKKGLAYLKKLTTKFPRSLYIDESYFAVGEYYFENELWQEALPNYKTISKKKSSRLFAFSTYKMAWCQYKMGSVAQGIKSLEKVILNAKSNKIKANGRLSPIRLADEALRDLIPFFAETKNFKVADRYFSKFLKRKKVNKSVERLAYYYVQIGNREAARYLFRELIQKNVDNPKAFDYQYQIINMYSSAKELKIFNKELNHWVESFGPKSFWYKRNNKNKKFITQAMELMETSLRTFILQNHQTAQNSRGTLSRNLAFRGYALYFSTFKKTANYGNMRFYYAELLYDLKKYELAANNYLWILKNNKKNKYYKKSMVNGLLALENQIPSSKKIKEIVGDSDQPIKLDKISLKFEKIARLYFGELPKGKIIVQLKYKLATIYMDYNHFQEAEEILYGIIEKHASSKYAAEAGHLLLEIYNKKKDYLALERIAGKILAVPTVSATKFGLQVKQVMTQAAFSRAKKMEGEKEFLESAKQYENFYKKYGNNDLTNAAKFNAALNYEKAGKVLLAIPIYKTLAASSGNKNKLLKLKSRKILVGIYEKTGQYALAASELEKLAIIEKNYKKAVQYLNNAAIYRDGMGHYKSSLKSYNLIFKKEKRSRRVETQFYIAKNYEKQNNAKSAIFFYKKYIGLNPQNKKNVVESAFRVAELSKSIKWKKEASKWYTKTIVLKKRLRLSGEANSWAAESLFNLVEKKYFKLIKVRIPKLANSAAKAIKKKQRLLKRLIIDLKKVIGYNDGYQVVSSLALSGMANADIYKSILSAPIPKVLLKPSEAERLKQYKAGIESLAAPHKVEALSLFKNAIEKASRLESYDKWVLIAHKELNKLDPEHKVDLEEKVILTKLPDWLDRKIKSGDSKADKSLLEKLKDARKDKNLKLVKKIAAEVLAEHEFDLYTLNTLALTYFSQGQKGLAKILLERALSKNKKSPGLYNNYGIIYLSEEKKKKAITAFRQALKVSRNYRVANTNLGAIYLEYKDYSRALAPLEGGYEIVESALNKNQNTFAVNVANNYALALKGAKNFDKSKDIFARIVSAGTSDPNILINYASLLVENFKNDKEEAISLISKIKIASNDRAVLKKAEQLEKIVYSK